MLVLWLRERDDGRGAECGARGVEREYQPVSRLLLYLVGIAAHGGYGRVYGLLQVILFYFAYFYSFFSVLLFLCLLLLRARFFDFGGRTSLKKVIQIGRS